MALKNVRFTWDTPPLSGGLWRFGLFNRQPHPGRPLPAAVPHYWKNYLHHDLHLSVRGLLAWATLLAFAAYFSAAALLYLHYERANPHNRVGYLDLVLPTRWSERSRLQGEGFILLGRDKLAAGRFGDGFALLRLGVDKNPADFAARLDLARLYLALRLWPQAQTLLREGLAHGYPGRAYLESAFALASESDNPPAWIELCELARRCFDDVPPAARPAGDSLWLDQQTVKALLAGRRGAEAAALVARRYPEKNPFRREVTVVSLLEDGDASAALALAATWAAEQPGAPEPLRLLVRAQRQAGEFIAMDETLVRLRALDPAKPEALLYALVQNQLAGRPAQARAALAELLFRHGANPALYPALAAVLVEIRLPEELPPLVRELRERGLSPRPALWARLQADIAARDWPAALATAGEIRSSTGPAFTEIQSAWLETMTRLARACADAGSGHQTALVGIVADHPGTLRLYRVVLDALLEAGRIETAAQILSLAEGPYPAARNLAAIRATIEARRAELAAAEPSPSAPVRSGAFASLKELTEAFSTRVREHDSAGALALLAAVRRTQPAWLGGSEHRLDALELPIRARDDDPLRLQLLARNALARETGAPAALLDLAREVYEEGNRANALLLVKELLRHEPSHAEALAQLAHWEPRTNQRPLDIIQP